MRSRGEGILGWFRLWGGSFCSPDMLRTRGSGHVRRKGGTTVLGIVSQLLASKTLSLFHAFGLFDWGKLRQGDGIDLHGIEIMLGV